MCGTKDPSTKSSITSKLHNALYEKFTDYHVRGWIQNKFNYVNPQPKNIPELKTALLMIWEATARSYQKVSRQLPQSLRSCINAKVGHFEYNYKL